MVVQFKADSVATLVEAAGRARQGDSLELDPHALPRWRAGLDEGGWLLTDGQASVPLGTEGAATSRITIDGRRYLLVGDNGFASVQSAIDVAAGGETLLIAPGTYGEGRAFSGRELGGIASHGDSLGLHINKPLCLQGVTEAGQWVTDCDDITAAILALHESRDGVSFLINAAGVNLRGLGLVPAGASWGSAPRAASLAVRGTSFGLHACVVERNRAHGSTSAVHFPRRDDFFVHQAVLSDNVLYGSVTLDAPGDMRPMDVTIVGNEIIGERLPPILVTCDPGVLAASPVQPFLPLVEDNTLRTTGEVTLALALRIDGKVDGEPAAGPDIVEYLRRVLDSHDGAGAVVVRPDGCARMHTRALSPVSMQAPVTGIHSTIQAAIDNALPADTLHVGAGVYRERLLLSGKGLSLVGATDARGEPLVRLLPPDPAGLRMPGNEARPSVVIELGRRPAVRTREATAGTADMVAGAEASMAAPVDTVADDAAPDAAAELADEGVLDLLGSPESRALPVRHFGGDGRRKGAYATIQEAIDAAAEGDRIEVAPGEYAGDLLVSRPLTLLGANAGRPGHSSQRGLESTVLGSVAIRCGPGEVVIDGMSIRGEVSSQVAAGPRSHLALRCCVIDASGLAAAVTIQSGSGTMLAGNRICSGTEEGIHAPCGFDDLVISGNRLESGEGASGIVLHAGAGTDSAYILGNTVIGGDYGILVEGGLDLEGPGDSITIAGNCFGEMHDGIAWGAPAVAAICTDRPVSRALERSLGACLESNVYNLSATAVPVDIAFESGARQVR